MTDKSLQDKAINIKGKEYVQVKDRLVYFNENYPNGRIETEIVSDGERVVVRAKVTPDVKNIERYFTGVSASNPSKALEKQSPHEIAETSAVGRALAMMGIGVIDAISSADEMAKVGQVASPQPASKLVGYCDIHDAKMTERISKRTGAPYFAHETAEGLCFGN